MKKNIFTYIFLFLTLVLAYYIYMVNRNPFTSNEEINVPEETDTLVILTPLVNEFGFSQDSLSIIDDKIKRNQNLSHILVSYRVSGRDIHTLSEKSKDIFDIRKIRAGNSYRLFVTNDSLPVCKYFVYQHSPVEYVVFHLNDSLYVSVYHKKIQTVQKTARGEVRTSLWNDMQESNINPLMANELSEIFAWTIDFFGLQKGDEFKVMYEEFYVDSVSVGLGKIHAAYFKHAGEDFYAIPFIQNGERSFYDQQGNSLRKAFLKAPLKFSRISSRFSHSRLHPILKIRRPHHGIDYAAPVGTPVHAVGDGKVISVNYSGGAGRMVKIRHNSVYTTAYLHLSRYGKGIASGAYVKQGDIVGYVGSSGLSTGPHLDFRFYMNGKPVDPLKVKSPPVEPVNPELMKTFGLFRDKLTEDLQRF